MALYKVSFLVIIIAVLCYITFKKTPIQITEKILKDYDYIIVGGGSGGSPVAARLSEDPDVHVLLLEAGPAEYPNTDIPANVLYFSEIDWNVEIEPQSNCCKDRVLKYPQGKILGGTSTINSMLYFRGSRHDYDAWEEMGCEGWGYDDVLPYFIKSEGNQNQEFIKSSYHGSEGPLKVTDLKNNSLVNIFVKAGQELGHPHRDLNGESQLGFMEIQATTYKGRRCSTAEAYIRFNTHRKNLHIATGAHVTKIVFEGTKAVGVDFIRDGDEHRVNSRREVILSAGSIRSPQILMLSGVGPKQELEKHEIPVVVDLPVGQNLQDHVLTEAGSHLLEAPISFNEYNMLSISTVMEYFIFGTGQLSHPQVEASAFLLSSIQPEEHQFPYIQLLLMPSLLGSSPTYYNETRHFFGYTNEVFDTLYGNLSGQHGFLIEVLLMHPRSRGNITLQSKDPMKQPKINPNYFQDPADLDILVDGIKFVTKLENTNAFKSVGGRISRRIHPYCKEHEWGSDEYWRCYIRNNANPVFHPASTCKMGSVTDSSTVVDPRLRVKGTEGLRVADASIMPFVVSGNTNAPTIMIGEKAADIIKQDRKNI